MNQTEEKTMFKNAGRVKRTIEEYFVPTVATLRQPALWSILCTGKALVS